MATCYLLFTVLFVTFVQSICNTDQDCSYNGICDKSTGSCECDIEWFGEYCGRLNVLPTILNNGYNEANTSSWGGSIIHSKDDNSWHMFVTRIKNHCGIKSFKNNSEIIHAISSNNNPLGPYTFKQVILENFAHNPSIYYFNNTYYLYHIGCGNQSTSLRTDCVNGTTPGTPTQSTDSNHNYEYMNHEVSYCDMTNWTALMTTNEINGINIGFDKQPNEILIVGDKHTYKYTSNPAALFNKNGSLYFVYHQNKENWPDTDNGAGKERIGISFGYNADGPFTDLTPNAPIQKFHLEDAYIWRDNRSYFHIIAHKRDPNGPFPNGCSSHLYSKDAINWVYGFNVPYNNTIYYVDGSFHTYENNARQRPQLVIENGKPKYLSTAIYNSNQTGDYAYTVVQPIMSNT